MKLQALPVQLGNLDLNRLLRVDLGYRLVDSEFLRLWHGVNQPMEVFAGGSRQTGDFAVGILIGINRLCSDSDPRNRAYPGEGFDGVVRVSYNGASGAGVLLGDRRAILTAACLLPTAPQRTLVFILELWVPSEVPSKTGDGMIARETAWARKNSLQL